MAVYFHNTLLASGDFIRITRKYSSAQSLWRAHKNKLIGVFTIGSLRFVTADPNLVAKLHGIPSWDGLLTKPMAPEGLSPLSRISKKIGVGESVMLGWALHNRMDVYWVGGHFAASLQAAQLIADAEEKRKALHTRPPKASRKNR